MEAHAGADLRHKEHNQRDVGGEDDGERGEGEGRVLLAGQDHGDRGGDEAQDLCSVFGALSSAGSAETQDFLSPGESP